MTPWHRNCFHKYNISYFILHISSLEVKHGPLSRTIRWLPFTWGDKWALMIMDPMIPPRRNRVKHTSLPVRFCLCVNALQTDMNVLFGVSSYCSKIVKLRNHCYFSVESWMQLKIVKANDYALCTHFGIIYLRTMSTRLYRILSSIS